MAFIPKKQKLTACNTTHFLKCSHINGKSRVDYLMRCHVLKTMLDGRKKVLVFGDRFWRLDQPPKTEIKSRERYVESYRVIAKSEVRD